MLEHWYEIKEHLGRILDNEARIFSDSDLEHLEEIIQWDDKKLAAPVIAEILINSALEGELLSIYAERIGQLIGEPLDVHSATSTPIYERSAWVTNPEAKTFEIGW